MNLNLGKLFGIPIYIHWSWWIFLVLQAIVNIDFLTVAIAMFGIVLLHELGHCFAARYFGVRVDSITLHIMGGLALVDGRKQTPKEEFWIILCGPLVNFILAFPLYFIGEHSEFFARLFLLNLLMLIFNLVPAFPLDGSKLGRSVLSLVTNERFATKTFVVISKIIAVAVGVLALSAPLLSYNAPYLSWLMILAIIIWFAADAERSEMPLAKANTNLSPTDESLDILQSARDDLKAHRRKYQSRD